MNLTETKTSFKSFLNNYYLTCFFYDFVWAYAIYAALFHLRGISIFQISILLAIWSLSGVLFEIPSGALADYGSRKKMLTVAPLIKSLCFVIWFFAGSNFYLFALGFIVWSVASSFVSGTVEAVLFDTLKHFGKSDEYEKYIGRKHFYLNISLAVAMLFGGLLAQINIGLPVILSVLPLFLSSVFASRLIEVPKAKSTEETKYFSYFKIAFKEIVSNKTLIYLFIYALIIAGIFGNLEEFDQLYYQSVHLPLFAFGIAGFIWSILIATTSNYAYKLKKYPFVYYLLSAISGIFLFVVSRFPSVPIIILLLFAYATVAPLKVLIESKVQKEIKSISRATVTSIVAFLEQAFGVILLLSFGLISRKWNIQAIYFTASMLLILFSIWSFFLRRIWNNHRERNL